MWTTDLFAVLSPSHGPFSRPHHPLSIRVVCTYRVFVPIATLLDFLRWIALCGTFGRNGNVGSTNKTISARSTLNTAMSEIAACAHSNVIYRKRSTASTGSERYLEYFSEYRHLRRHDASCVPRRALEFTHTLPYD